MIHNNLIAVIVILVLYILYSNYSISCKEHSTMNKMVNGFYEADTSFCEESGLDMFCLYLDEDVDYYGDRACYILAKQDNEIIINEPIIANIRYEPKLFDYDISSPKYFNIEFKDLSDDFEEDFPKNQKIRFYPTIGKIVLFYEDTITAVLYKNPVNTELKSILKEEHSE